MEFSRTVDSSMCHVIYFIKSLIFCWFSLLCPIRDIIFIQCILVSLTDLLNQIHFVFSKDDTSDPRYWHFMKAKDHFPVQKVCVWWKRKIHLLARWKLFQRAIRGIACAQKSTEKLTNCLNLLEIHLVYWRKGNYRLVMLNCAIKIHLRDMPPMSLPCFRWIIIT